MEEIYIKTNKMIKGKIKKKIEELEQTLKKEGYILLRPPQITTEEASEYIPAYMVNGTQIEEKNRYTIKNNN